MHSLLRQGGACLLIQWPRNPRKFSVLFKSSLESVLKLDLEPRNYPDIKISSDRNIYCGQRSSSDKVINANFGCLVSGKPTNAPLRHNKFRPERATAAVWPLNWWGLIKPYVTNPEKWLHVSQRNESCIRNFERDWIWV
jgi:hypothetical protein